MLQPISVEVERDQINVVIFDPCISIHQLFEAIVFLHIEHLWGFIGSPDQNGDSGIVFCDAWIC